MDSIIFGLLNKLNKKIDDVGCKDCVQYIEQSLSDEQKAQARENIGIDDCVNELINTALGVIENGAY